MKVLLPMTYHGPYVSGPIVYADQLASELLARGHEVTILTSQHEPGLARDEWVDGVHIVRVPVGLRLSKGVLMPRYLGVAARLVRSHDVVVIQVPQLEAPLLAALAVLLRTPAMMTYHCDVQLPPGWFNRLADRVVLGGSLLTAALVQTIVAYTQDYADHSPVMRRFPEKVRVLGPPVALPAPSDAEVAAFRTRHGLHDATVVGIAGRFATEKGFEQLIATIPSLLSEFPDLRVLQTGELENVIGEEAYRDRLRPVLERHKEQWTPLGVIDRDELAAFFATCDVTVLPSLNRTESFGLVQVESMLCGTPVVASDLPGVRVPITETGMGIVVPVGDVQSLAAALRAVLRDPKRYVVPRADIEARWSPTRTADGYEVFFRELAGHSAALEEAREDLWPHLRDLPGFRAMIRAMEARLFRRLGPLEHPLLDVGTGDGHFAATVLESVDVGIDPSPDALREAAEGGAYRSLCRSSATHLPFAGATFATAVSNCVIEHIEDLPSVLSEVHRVLRPGGRFVFSVPTPRLNDELAGNRLLLALRAPGLAARYRSAFARIQRHHHMYEPAEWAARARAAGFEVVSSTGYMSARATRWFDVGHVTGVPTVATRRLTGRWVVWPWRPRFGLKERFLAPLVAEHDPTDATGCFLVVRKPAAL